MDKQSILFIEGGTSGYGGSYHSLYQIISGLGLKRYKFYVIFHSPSPFYEKFHTMGVKCFYVEDVLLSPGTGSFKFVLGKINGFLIKYLPFLTVLWERIVHFRSINKIIAIIKKNKIDLIHLNNQVVFNFFVLLSAQKTGVPVVSHLRTFGSYGLNQHKLSLIHELGVKFVAISEQLKKHWCTVGIDNRSITTIYNIVEQRGGGNAGQEDIPLEYLQFKERILFVGRLIECKGLSFLLRSFAKYKESHFYAGLFIVGDGTLCEKLKRLSVELGIENSVIFLGYQGRPDIFIRNASVLVLPSKMEGFGRVLLEAMSLGVPVIGTNVGGIPDIISHEVNGLLVSYGDEPALVEALKQITEQKLFREKMINNSYVKAQKFDKQNQLGSLKEIYRSLLSASV